VATHGAERARAKRCAHLQAVCLPTRRGASGHWKCHAGAPMLSVGPASIESLCLQRESGGPRSVEREKADQVCGATKTRRTKAKEDGARAAMHMAMRFWALPPSQCPGCPRVNWTSTHLGTQRATLASPTFGQDPRSVPARRGYGTPQDSARGRCVRRWSAPPLGMLADRGPLWLSPSPVTTAGPYLSSRR
jgi:hypothetical protein